MERLRAEGMVTRSFLTFSESGSRDGNLVAVQLAGIVVCHQVIIRIDKKMAVRRDRQNRYQVRTQYYQYHAMVARRNGQPRRNLIRFDNAHGEDGLHCHRFDAIGSEVSRVPISLEHLPTLDEFVRLAVAIAEGSRLTSARLGR